MRVTPVSPATGANNDTRPACQYARGQARKARTEPANAPQSSASVSLGVYGAPGPFGTFAAYGNFSVKV